MKSKTPTITFKLFKPIQHDGVFCASSNLTPAKDLLIQEKSTWSDWQTLPLNTLAMTPATFQEPIFVWRSVPGFGIGFITQILPWENGRITRRSWEHSAAPQSRPAQRPQRCLGQTYFEPRFRSARKSFLPASRLNETIKTIHHPYWAVSRVHASRKAENKA